MPETELKRTPLYEAHRRLNARMVDFSGWAMPVQYASIIAEHKQTRQGAGLFDISHMGEFILQGPGATADLSRLLTCRMEDLAPGRCRYGFLLNEQGGIVDDLIVFHLAESEYMLVVNAATTEKDKAWIQAHLSSDTIFNDISTYTAKIDLQGPVSNQVIKKVSEDHHLVTALKRFALAKIRIAGVDVLISRTGYTGELGYELFMDWGQAEKIWETFYRTAWVTPAGLGARDSLRLEKGLCLYGSDIDENHTPRQAGLMRFVDLDKDFIGRAALTKELPPGTRSLTGFICQTRRSAHRHFPIQANSRIIGEVTSACFSPQLCLGIGMGYVEKELVREGMTVTLGGSGNEIPAKLKSLPILDNIPIKNTAN